MRLDKYLADMSSETRSEVKQLIKSGRVLVNGVCVKKPETKINEENDEVIAAGRKICYEKNVYYMLNKPAGVITATEDKRQKTVLDLLPESINKNGLFPVGRLDKDTEGLLIITNDGELSHRLLSPVSHVGKTYFVRVTGIITEEEIKLLENGIDIGDEKPTRPAVIAEVHTSVINENITDIDNFSEMNITITEGRYHQIKRMYEKTGHKVTFLKRLSMGKLILDKELKPGEYKKIGINEIE